MGVVTIEAFHINLILSERLMTYLFDCLAKGGQRLMRGQLVACFQQAGGAEQPVAHGSGRGSRRGVNHERNRRLPF